MPKHYGQQTEAEADDQPGCCTEAVRDDNVEVGRKTKCEQQQGHCGKTSSDRKEPRACASLLDQTMLQGWGDQKADGDRHDRKSSNVQTLRQSGKFPEASLESGIEMKAKQDLGAKDQEPRFIKRRFDFFVIGAGHGF